MSNFLVTQFENTSKRFRLHTTQEKKYKSRYRSEKISIWSVLFTDSMLLLNNYSSNKQFVPLIDQKEPPGKFTFLVSMAIE